MDALDGTIFHVVPIFVQFHKKESTQENCHQKTKVKILIQKYSIHPSWLCKQEIFKVF